MAARNGHAVYSVDVRRTSKIPLWNAQWNLRRAQFTGVRHGRASGIMGT
jgi:hypothetical protein